MFRRSIFPSENNSFFLFGARGVGKSTYLREQFLPRVSPEALYLDLLEDTTERRYRRNPDFLIKDVKDWKKDEWIVIDEIQKNPKLLDIVQKLITETKRKFVLTGSSARKLKLSSANLLAGRAFTENMFPLTHIELGSTFNLNQALQWGTLPGLFSQTTDNDRKLYLESYANTYVREEIQMEQLIRKLPPFKSFLEIAAQMSGKIINYLKIAKEVDVDEKTVISYYDILEQTYIGYRVRGFHKSIRKSQRVSPKFYFFDHGVKRAVERSLQSEIPVQTSYYGEAFEHFCVAEIIRLNSYGHNNYAISYLGTTAGGEVDIVLSRARSPILLIEIKSAEKINEIEIRKLATYVKDIPDAKGFYLSQDRNSICIEGVECLHWMDGLKKIFSTAKL